MITLFACLAIAGSLIFFNPHKKVQALITALLFFATAYFLSFQLSGEVNNFAFVGLVGSFVFLNYFVGGFTSKSWIKYIAPVITIVGLLLVGSQDWYFGDYLINFSSPRIYWLIILGFSIGYIVELKKLVLKRLFPNLKSKELDRSIYLILIGLLILFAAYFASWFGFFMLAMGVAAYNFYGKEQQNYLVISLLMLTVAGAFMINNSFASIDLSIPKMLAGLFIGGAISSLGYFGLTIRNRPLGLFIATLGVLLLIMIISLDQVNAAYGGFETYTAALVGMSLVIMVQAKSAIGVYLFPLVMLVGITFQPKIELNSSDNSTLSEEIKPSEEELDSFISIESIDLKELSGSYKIDQAGAMISFELGQKGGVTKGKIEPFEGFFDFDNGVIEVELKTENLTTFNSMRDESVMGEEYLNAVKFPSMIYNAKIIENNDGEYNLKGEFEMLGVKHEVNVVVKWIKNKSGELFCIGRGALDRRDFGMASSPSEGNEVRFEFDLKLVK